MKKLMNIIMLSCNKATLLIEKSHAAPLSFMDRVKLKMHLAMCDKCAGYQKQSLIIENALKSNRQSFSNPSNLKLADTSKTRIQKAIDDNLKK
ncbi:MAG: hypothetical protein J0L69_14465 [Bacteroidetes bacterium]|nr:hypothetical protein [Bacteroidota bacterium]